LSYEIHYKPSAARAVAKLPRVIQRRVTTKVENLGLDPRPRGCEKLIGPEDLFRVRLGDYRVIYQIQDDRLVVLVVAVGHRGNIYRQR